MRMLAFTLCLALLPGLLHAAPVEAAAARQDSIVRVSVTSQAYDFFRPWSKKPPFTKRGLGALLDGGRFLVTAELVANATYVELEKAETGEKTVASVDVVDYECDLALVKPADPDFVSGMKPLELIESSVGDTVYAWQLEPTGALLITSGLVTTVEVAGYPVDDTALLIYRLTSSLQYREGSFVLPFIREDKLTGMLMRYDPRTQNADVIPATVIAHFLKEARTGSYKGFPRAGIQYAPMRDPQLRRYAGLDEKSNGSVYITDVADDGSADKAGVKKGDILLAIDDVKIDQDGNYRHPKYGKISISHLIATERYTGDVVKFHILRDKQPLTLDVTLLHKNAQDFEVPPYVIDQAPDYYILGGLVLQELSRQYLKEWGGDWEKQAPQRLVYFDRYYDEVFGEKRGRIVILSQVLPSPDTIGYEGLSYLVVTKINDVPIKRLADVAEAIKKPVGGFHKIEFSDDPRVIYLDAAEVKANELALKETYGLSALQRGVE